MAAGPKKALPTLAELMAQSSKAAAAMAATAPSAAAAPAVAAAAPAPAPAPATGPEVSEQAQHGDKADASEGTCYLVSQRTPIFVEPDYTSKEGILLAGDRVQASGPAVIAKNRTLVPLRPRGAAQLCHLYEEERGMNVAKLRVQLKLQASSTSAQDSDEDGATKEQPKSEETTQEDSMSLKSSGSDEDSDDEEPRERPQLSVAEVTATLQVSKGYDEALAGSLFAAPGAMARATEMSEVVAENEAKNLELDQRHRNRQELRSNAYQEWLKRRSALEQQRQAATSEDDTDEEAPHRPRTAATSSRVPTRVPDANVAAASATSVQQGGLQQKQQRSRGNHESPLPAALLKAMEEEARKAQLSSASRRDAAFQATMRMREQQQAKERSSAATSSSGAAAAKRAVQPAQSDAFGSLAGNSNDRSAKLQPSRRQPQPLLQLMQAPPSATMQFAAQKIEEDRRRAGADPSVPSMTALLAELDEEKVEANLAARDKSIRERNSLALATGEEVITVDPDAVGDTMLPLINRRMFSE